MDKNLKKTDLTIHDRVRQFVKTKLDPVSLQVDLTGHISEEIVDQMRAMKLFGLAIPEEYGGLGGSLRDLAGATFAMGTACPSTALAYFFHCSSASPGLLALEALVNLVKS